ncbi:MAG: tyrosine-type recombinase/integrase [Pseudomonadota bacterium]
MTDWFVINHSASKQAASDVRLADVAARYYDQHGQHVVSAERISISLAYWLDFFGTKTIEEIGNAELQREFHTWLLDKGMKKTSAKRVVSDGRAAINYAWKRGEIASAPFVMPISTGSNEAAPPKGRPLELKEIVALYSNTKNPNLTMFITLMLATAARPDAVLGLTRDRMKVEDRLIVLNPEDRPQTKKYRPTLRMPESIVPLIESIETEISPLYLVGLRDTPLKGVRTSWRTARKNAQLDNQVNPYSLRHTMARWLRKERVSGWEISAQLGHKRQDLSITEIYAPYDPTYLQNAAKAIDSFFAQLRAKSVLVDAMLKR